MAGPHGYVPPETKPFTLGLLNTFSRRASAPKDRSNLVAPMQTGPSPSSDDECLVWSNLSGAEVNRMIESAPDSAVLQMTEADLIKLLGPPTERMPKDEVFAVHDLDT